MHAVGGVAGCLMSVNNLLTTDRSYDKTEDHSTKLTNVISY